MDNENPEVVNQTETGAVDSPQTESTETADVSQVSPRSDKEVNLEKAVAKFRRELKQRDEVIRQYQSQETKQPSGQEDGRVWLEQKLNEAVSPIYEKLEQSEREQAIVDVFSQPYSKELQPEITQEFQNLPDNLPFADRLRLARNNAIANNIDVITKLHTEAGKQEAYSNQSLKKQQVGLGESNPGRSESEKTIFEKYKAGELTQPEIKENFDQIQKEKKKELGIS